MLDITTKPLHFETGKIVISQEDIFGDIMITSNVS